MAYNNAIPEATDRIKDSQPAIKANFAAIKTVVDINHVTFDDPSGNQGKHKFVSLPEQAAVPAIVADEVKLYSKDSAYNVGTTVLAHMNEAGTVYEIGAGGTSWAILPCGTLMKWGASQWNIGNPQDHSFIVASGAADGPAFTSVSSMQCSVYNTTADYDKHVTLKTFTVGTQTVTYNCSRRTTTAAVTGEAVQFYYLIIGR